MGNVPVEGWTAEEVPFMSWMESRATTTFRVIDCPLFEPEEDYDKRMKNSCGLAEEGKRAESRKRIEEIERLFLYGFTDTAIALRYGLARSTVYNYRKAWRKKQQE